MSAVRKLPWQPIFAWSLAAFFVLGSAINMTDPASTAAEYRSWGYPDWFHFVTGGLELTTAVLLALARTRQLGAVLGCAVMVAAAATVIVHGAYVHVIPPAVVFALAALVGRGARRSKPLVLADHPRRIG